MTAGATDLLRGVRTRLAELGYAISPLRSDEVVGRFGRTAPPPGGLHVLLTRAGAPIAYSLWPIACRDRIDAALDTDLHRLRAAGRLVVHMVDVFDRGMVLRSEMLAAPDLSCTRIAIVERAMCATLTRMWPRPARRLLEPLLGAEAA